ncbi:MAG: F0F1 ATP synthase subunit epsilon [Balneolaceae bacterium]|nr:F0F1 ATP synthase subunit epsilon [Bacteroidota bacterium]MDR9388261.1 F0F1 ATP synthase subunit epsilon [Balneolaceae bacterium]MDR9447091.1 F0F1 ATP synthase subunit epsilon [Balneolaceae bacterium]
MANETFSAKIMTPVGKAFEGDVQSVSLPGEKGRFQVLYGHAPILSTLVHGDVHVVDAAGTRSSFNVQVGFVEMVNNSLTLLAESVTDGASASSGAGSEANS